MAELTVTVFSHHFAVSNISGRAHAAVMEFARRNVQYGVEKSMGRWVRVAKKVYAAATRDRSSFRFHINQLEDFEHHLKRHFLTGADERVVQPFKEIDPVTLEIKEGWVPRGDQIPVIEYICADTPHISRFVDLQTGKGKAETLTAKIRIPGGWSTMGEMQVGQTVIAADGTETKVIAVHPQGVTPVYKVTFADGRSVKCSPEHLWKVYYINTVPHKRWRVVDTMEVLRLISMPNPRVYVQLIEPEVQPQKDFPIPPYTLGAILGDGHIGNGVIQITKPDEDLFAFIEEELLSGHCLGRMKRGDKCPTYSLKRSEDRGENAYVAACREWGLAGLKAADKFIPDEYFEGSRAQRLALLQGLMDTDGTANSLKTGGAISFNSTSLRLAKGVQYLVRSLGGIASISARQTHYTHDGVKKPGQPSYDVNIRYKTPSELFRIARKKERTNDNSQYCADLKLRVTSVEYAGEEPTQCITIDHPDHLYVTDDFIVTHNSFITMYSAAKLQARGVYIFRPMYLDKWVIDIRKTYEIAHEDLMTVQGSGELIEFLELMRTGEWAGKVVLVSNKTFQNYLKLYEEHGDAILEMGYACTPVQFFEFVGSTLRVIDEVHLDFHLNFKIDLYTHVKRSVSLSATMLSDDPKIEEMMNLAYPSDQRYQGGVYDKYIATRAVFYQLADPHKVKWKAPYNSNYSHNVFEQSIMRDRRMLDNYVAMHIKLLEATWLTEDYYKPGDRSVVFCASIDLCTIMTERLSHHFTKFSVKRYVGSLNDPYDNLMEPDLRVTTHGSAGTAVDIPQLTVTVMGIALRSSAGSLQNLGRLRKLADGREPLYVYLNCSDIPKHIEYHDHRTRLLDGKTTNYRVDHLRTLI